MKVGKWWRRVWSERRQARLDKMPLVKKITTLQESLEEALGELETQRTSRDTERSQRIDRERILKQQVRELEETVAVNKITIENLTYETTRNRERLRAELAMSIADRKNYLEGEARA